jgi:hypothetical protein
MQGVALGELFATATSQRLLMALQIAPNVEDKAAAISLSCGGLKPLTMERLIAACEKCATDKDHLEAQEALTLALDEFAVAQAASTFEWASGPLKL